MNTRRFRPSLFSLATICTVIVCFFALAACSVNAGTNTEFSFNSDDAGLHIAAKNGADATQTDSYTVKPGAELNVKAVVNKGSFQLKATDSTGKVVLDEEIKESTTKSVPAEGKVEVEVTAMAADGTVDIS